MCKDLFKWARCTLKTQAKEILFSPSLHYDTYFARLSVLKVAELSIVLMCAFAKCNSGCTEGLQKTNILSIERSF